MKTSSDLTRINAEGNDRSLHDTGHSREYWYSIGDGFRLLSAIRKKLLVYTEENNSPYIIKAPGEEYTATRQNRHKILVTDPYFIDNFATSLDDDIKTITGRHITDEHGTDQRAKNNLWSLMPNIIVIPLLSGGHWRSIRIQIDYATNRASILYDDPYGAQGFSDALIAKIKPALGVTISKLISHVAGNEITLDSINIITEKKSIDQQESIANGYDCGPITFSNIADYINYEITNEQFISDANLYSISLATDITHEEQMLEIRATDIATYKEESGVAMPGSILERIIQIKQLLKNSVEKKKQYIEDKAELSIVAKISSLSAEVCAFIFEIIDNERSISGKELSESYSTEELNKAYNLLFDKQEAPKRLSGSFYNDVVGLDSNKINKLLEEMRGDLKQLVFATGTDNFAKIIQEDREFIDKSLFIKEVVDSGDEVVLITRPRRWGKTTNMEMLKSFLSVSVDKQGNPLSANSNEALFDKLLIGKESEIISKYYGKYPVIFISFKNVKSNDYQSTEDLLKTEIKKLYRQYSYLLHSSKLEDFYKDDLKKYLQGDIARDSIKESLQFLSEILFIHHEEKIYILIDEYDTPLNHAYNNPDYTQTLELMRSILGITLKGNNNLKKAIVTGITKIAKAGLFSDINNVGDYSILESKYAEYFGFTENEVEALLDKALIEDVSIKRAVKEWYNGYQIGKHIIYNPWSIANFFKDVQIRSYWVNTESMVLGDRRFSTDLLVTDVMQEQVRKMVVNCKAGMKQTIEITLNPEVIFTNLKNDPTAAWTLLAYSGYLSLSDRYLNEDLTATYQVRIPNREVMGIYMSSISLWLKDKLAIDLKDLNNLLKDFDLEDVDQVPKVTERIIAQYGSRVAQENESIFHSLIEVICLLGGKSHILSSEKKSGTGRIDSIFYPIAEKSDKIIIHEYKILKKATKEEDINIKVQEALWQVYEKCYLEEVITKFHNFDYAHYKDVEVRAIVILIDENNRHIGMKVDSISHSMRDSIKILDFFKLIKDQQLVKFKDKFDIQKVIIEIKTHHDQNEVMLKLQEEEMLNVNSMDVAIPESIILKLGQAIHNKKLAMTLISSHGYNLFDMEQKDLCKLDGVGKKRAQDIEEIGQQYKKAKADTSQQVVNKDNDGSMDIVVGAVFSIKYDNILLNHEKLPEILAIAKERAGAVAVIELMNLQNSETFDLSESNNAGEIVDQIIERNSFLNNQQGREFIQAIDNHFDREVLLDILELGRDQELAEQILIELDAQGINGVISTLLGKELSVSEATDNLENILGTEELHQLRLVPNGILNSWSNKAYNKIADYIDQLAKNLDYLLNAGKSGNQIAVTLTLLEELLNFAASGERFVGGMPPYYNPDDDNDWSYGGGSSDGNNNSSAGDFANQNGFTGLILPLYNGTDYDNTDHQI